MSRIGKKTILIPEKTQVITTEQSITVKGPLGELSKPFRSSAVSVTIADQNLTLAPLRNDVSTRALWGTYAAHIINMIKGVNQPFQKKLVIEGIGYKCELKGDELVFALGFSHPVKMKVPKGLKAVAEKGTITISGSDKDSVGQFAAEIRDLKKPEPYKGKGIRYEGERVKIKEGKKSA